ncbi:MAG TPA: peptide chain release factor N(5)-glutamine methyltransferase, partial [Alphaproteobacteria bacterium]
MDIDTALKNATEQFQSVDPATAGMDARILMQHVLHYDLAQLMLYRKQDLTADQLSLWQDYVAQRLAHKPVAKITGEKEFYGVAFKTSEATLDPRPDSETLIEQVQKFYPLTETDLRILDLGTGTGCLLLTLLRLYPHATGIGADISLEALQVAQDNAYLHRLLERSELIQSNWFDKISGTFDLIISNPPYIDHTALAQLSRSVKDYDPMLALDGGPDGLEPYRIITAQAVSF